MGASPVRRLRDQLGLTQAEAARRLGVSQRTYARYEVLDRTGIPGYVVRLIETGAMHVPVTRTRVADDVDRWNAEVARRRNHLTS